MSMDRWDPFRDMMTFREAMDRWVQQGISGTGQLLSTIRPDAIAVDVIERDDAFEVRASVPGVKPEDLEVTVQGERITIRAEARAQEERRGETWLTREHRYGTMQRSITLPAAVSSEHAEARLEHGVLSLRLPKVQASPPHRINVAASPSSPVISSGASAASSLASPPTSSSTPSATSSTTPPPAPSLAPAGSEGHPVSASTGNAAHGSRDHTAQGDRVTEESQESFPASDPPSWTPETT